MVIVGFFEIIEDFEYSKQKTVAMDLERIDRNSDPCILMGEYFNVCDCHHRLSSMRLLVYSDIIVVRTCLEGDMLVMEER